MWRVIHCTHDSYQAATGRPCPANARFAPANMGAAGVHNVTEVVQGVPNAWVRRLEQHEVSEFTTELSATFARWRRMQQRRIHDMYTPALHSTTWKDPRPLVDDQLQDVMRVLRGLMSRLGNSANIGADAAGEAGKGGGKGGEPAPKRARRASRAAGQLSLPALPSDPAEALAAEGNAGNNNADQNADQQLVAAQENQPLKMFQPPKWTSARLMGGFMKRTETRRSLMALDALQDMAVMDPLVLEGAGNTQKKKQAVDQNQAMKDEITQTFERFQERLVEFFTVGDP